MVTHGHLARGHRPRWAASQRIRLGRLPLVVASACVGLVIATAAYLALGATSASAYLDYYGMHPEPGRALPETAFSSTGADLSLIWPIDLPDEPSPEPGLTNAQWVAQDILSKGQRGVPSVLDLGFMLGDVNPSNYSTVRLRVRRIAAEIRRANAMSSIYAVMGLDDSNCRYFGFRDRAIEIKNRKRVNRWLRRYFSKVALRGHVLKIGGWAENNVTFFCGPITADLFGLPGETVTFAYAYRQDGTHSCTYLGNPAPSPTDPDATANKIIADIDAMNAERKKTYMGLRPIIFFPSAYLARHAVHDTAVETAVACKMTDLWSRLKSEPPTAAAERDIRAFIPFNWHDSTAFHWIGIENSPPFREATAWVGRGR